MGVKREAGGARTGYGTRTSTVYPCDVQKNNTKNNNKAALPFKYHLKYRQSDRLCST